MTSSTPKISQFFMVLGIFPLILFLASCSLAEDITPPPGYQNSTPISPLEQGSVTPIAPATFTPPVNTATSAFVGTSGPTVSSVAPSSVVTITGKVIDATTGSPAAGPLTANLYLYNTTTSTIDKTLITEVMPTGQYLFENVPAETKDSYFVVVDFDGVTYASEPVTYDGKTNSLDVPITIYDATNDLTQLSVSQIHMQFDFPVSGQMQGRLLYIVSNLGNKAVMVQSDGQHIPFIQTPAGVTNVQFELAQGGSALAKATDGFALLPGADKQYGIISTFSQPYSNSFSLTQPFSLPVSSETVLVPVGVRVKSDQLNDAGIQNFQGTSYHIYQGGILASGSTLTLTISGKPGGSAGLALNLQLPLLAQFTFTCRRLVSDWCRYISFEAQSNQGTSASFCNRGNIGARVGR